MARKTLEQGKRAIDRIVADLERPTALEHDYASALLEAAVRNAAGRPTPQAPMAARNLVVDGSEIRPLAGGAPGEVGTSSEFGSSLYRQFHATHNPRGYWLYPAADAPDVLEAGDDALDRLVENAIR